MDLWHGTVQTVAGVVQTGRLITGFAMEVMTATIGTGFDQSLDRQLAPTMQMVAAFEEDAGFWSGNQHHLKAAR